MSSSVLLKTEFLFLIPSSTMIPSYLIRHSLCELFFPLFSHFQIFSGSIFKQTIISTQKKEIFTCKLSQHYRMYLFFTSHSHSTYTYGVPGPVLSICDTAGYKTERDPCLLEFTCWWVKTDNTVKT